MSAIMEQHTRWKRAHERLVRVEAKVVPPLLCPCCGHEIEGNAATKALALLPISPTGRVILNMVAAAYPNAVTGAVIHDAIYTRLGKRRPRFPNKVASIQTFRINEKIRPYGWEVQGAFIDAGSRRLVRIKIDRSLVVTGGEH